MKIENPNPIQWRFADRAEQLQSSFIREILKITQQPEIISFAGGLPSPLTFPVDEMKVAFDKVLSENGKVALQTALLLLLLLLPNRGALDLRQRVRLLHHALVRRLELAGS